MLSFFLCLCLRVLRVLRVGSYWLSLIGIDLRPAPDGMELDDIQLHA